MTRTRKMDKMGLCLLFLYVNFLAFTAANRPGLKIQMTIMVGTLPSSDAWGTNGTSQNLNTAMTSSITFSRREKDGLTFRQVSWPSVTKKRRLNLMLNFTSFTKLYLKFLEALKAFWETTVLLELWLEGSRVCHHCRRRWKTDGIKDNRKITDIVGARITFQTIDDILKFKKAYYFLPKLTSSPGCPLNVSLLRK